MQTITVLKSLSNVLDASVDLSMLLGESQK